MTLGVAFIELSGYKLINFREEEEEEEDGGGVHGCWRNSACCKIDELSNKRERRLQSCCLSSRPKPGKWPTPGGVLAISTVQGSLTLWPADVHEAVLPRPWILVSQWNEQWQWHSPSHFLHQAGAPDISGHF